MRYLLLIVLLTIGSTAYGQKVSSAQIKNNPFQWGFFYSSDINLSGEQIKMDEYMGYETEYNRHNFTAGLTAAYYWRNDLALRSGLTYANRKFTGTFYCYVCDFTTAPQPQDFDFAFVQLPIAIRYYPYHKRMSLFGELGVLNQLMVDDPTSSRLEGNTYSVSSLIGAGIAYDFSQRLSAQFSVQYNHRLSEMFKDTDYSYRILGFHLSIVKQF